MSSFSNLGFADSAAKNDITYIDYMNRLTLLAMTVYEWTNLPPSCNARFLEHALFWYGKAVFVDDPTFGILSLRATQQGQRNFYNEYTSITAYGALGYNKSFPEEKCALIKNNYLTTPTYLTIRNFAYRLWRLERTLDINIDTQKMPWIFAAQDKKQEQSLKAMYAQIDGNVPAIFADKDLFQDMQNRIATTPSNYVGDKLQIQKHQILNECLTFLGINNANMDKRERLITSEVAANQEYTDISCEVMLLTRQMACDEANKKFGLNIGVKFREFNKPNLDNELKKKEIKEEENGES